MSEPQTQPDDDFDLRHLARQMLIGVPLIMVAFGVAGWAFHEPLTRISEVFVQNFGLVGLFFGVLLVDSTVFTNEPLLFFGYAGGLGFWPVCLTASAASVLAGPVGWVMGRLVGRHPRIQAMIRNARIDVFMERYGFWAVTIAALTPIPYSLATWSSGASRMPFLPMLLGSLFRIPKTLFYFVIITVGWDFLPRLVGG